MAGEGVAAAVTGGRTLHHVGQRTVVLLHVEVRRGEVVHVVPQVLSDRERLQEHLGEEHGAADVQVDTAVAQLRHHGGEDLEVGVARGPDDGAVGGGVLVRDVGADGYVHGDRDPLFHTG